MSDQFTILVTDQNLVPLGDPIVEWTELDVTLRLNEPSSGLFKVPGHAYVREQLVPGCRISVMRHTDDGLGEGYMITGPMEKFIKEESDDGENAGVGQITVNFADDMARIAARQVYPDPAQTPEGNTVIDKWTYTGNAETALRQLVNDNAGPGALTARRIPGLVLDTVAGVGTSVTVTADRMQAMGEVMREIATVGGDLIFSTYQVGNQIKFGVRTPLDVSDLVRFGWGWGNLKYLAYEVIAPTATVIIAGGQGEGSERNLIEVANTDEVAAWGRYEKLLSTQGDDTVKATAEAERELGESAATVRLASSVVDSDGQRYGVDYGLGYKVAVESAPGQEIIDVVRTVHLQAWATSGSIISAFVGSQGANPSPAWLARIRAAEERLGRLERRVVPATA